MTWAFLVLTSAESTQGSLSRPWNEPKKMTPWLNLHEDIVVRFLSRENVKSSQMFFTLGDKPMTTEIPAYSKGANSSRRRNARVTRDESYFSFLFPCVSPALRCK